MNALSKRNPRPKWDTVQSAVQTVQTEDVERNPYLQVFEKNGGDDGTYPSSSLKFFHGQLLWNPVLSRRCELGSCRHR